MKTRKFRVLWQISLVSIFATACFGFNPELKKIKKEPLEGKNFAVVELFTSEGCSSCPPADDLVAKLFSEKNQELYILSFHVDYWDRLGWKDPFSKAVFSQRQREYARAFSLESVYTPQVVVNGSDQFVGSNETSLRSSLQKPVQPSNLSIEASKNDQSIIHISYTISNKGATLLQLALVQPEAETAVRGGENSGRKLHHVNIVRELKTIETKLNTGTLDIEIPKELRSIPLRLIAFTQQKDDLKIKGVARADIN